MSGFLTVVLNRSCHCLKTFPCVRLHRRCCIFTLYQNLRQQHNSWNRILCKSRKRFLTSLFSEIFRIWYSSNWAPTDGQERRRENKKLNLNRRNYYFFNTYISNPGFIPYIFGDWTLHYITTVINRWIFSIQSACDFCLGNLALLQLICVVHHISQNAQEKTFVHLIM